MYKHLYSKVTTCSEKCAKKLNDSAWRYKNLPKEREKQKKWRRNYTKRLKGKQVKILSVQIPEEYFEVMDELVKLGKFKNKSKFVQEIVHQYLWNVLDSEKGTTDELRAKITAGDEKCKLQG